LSVNFEVLFTNYLATLWLCDNCLGRQKFIRDILFELGFGEIMFMVDKSLANRCRIHEAVLNLNLSNVEKLLERKESITQKDREGRTPLHLAVNHKRPELIRLLLQHRRLFRFVPCRVRYLLEWLIWRCGVC
jgi:ankyrin repeat protein